MSFVKFHRRPMEGDFLLVEIVLLEKQELLNQIHLLIGLQQGRHFKQLVRENEVYALHLLLLQRSLQYLTSSQ